jgi:hypothetical protein
MRLRQGLFDQPAPSAYGFSREEVLRLIEQELTERIATGRETLDAYFFTETFSVGVARVVVRPATVVDKQTVVGERTIPMRISYAWSPLPGGGYRVMLPRFGWWILLETLELAPDALRTAVGAALLGGQQSWVYDFDQQGEDDVQVFEPAELARSRSAPKRPERGGAAARRLSHRHGGVRRVGAARCGWPAAPAQRVARRAPAADLSPGAAPAAQHLDRGRARRGARPRWCRGSRASCCAGVGGAVAMCRASGPPRRTA